MKDCTIKKQVLPSFNQHDTHEDRQQHHAQSQDEVTKSNNNNNNNGSEQCFFPEIIDHFNILTM